MTLNPWCDYRLIAGANQISGTIPEGIKNLIGLTWLVISMNSITGEIPVGIGKLERLEDLRQFDNRISGEIPADLGNTTQLGQFDGLTVAVKVLNLTEKGAAKSFVEECNALRGIRHRNLIKILTTCLSIDSKGDDFKAIVFEFMPNGSLEAAAVDVAEPKKILADEGIVSQLASMGFNYLHCQKAAINTSNAGVEEAMNWLLFHMDDPATDWIFNPIAFGPSDMDVSSSSTTIVDSALSDVSSRYTVWITKQ
ncbi:hypothetical protein TEA_006059 [Camellia sinensis var. sinensis]|uniref:ubiquitinyl hydrolase 1 n=1 Tax=Camellia sinensis var. sinensis TaxID=542762 RepID=A0A4S4D100_CAMSN|nr:hypothetical protein TEA_006059 [Camellia sinensis var. sinensis]